MLPGRSTELARLAEDLRDRFFLVTASARSLNLADLNYVDIILAVAAGLIQKITQKASPVRVPNDLLKDVLDWLTKEISRETTITVTKSGTLSGKLQAWVLSLQGKYARETATRTTVRDRLYVRLTDLIERINAICSKFEQLTHPPLIIFEDIDKADIALSRALFFEHANTLTSPACRIIYTFPIALRHTHDFATSRRREYSRDFSLPNISLNSRSADGAPNPMGHHALREVITRRISPEIFGDGVLDYVVQLSGGLLSDLVRLVGDAALVALTEGIPQITREIVEQVARDTADAYRRILLPAHYNELRQARVNKNVDPNDIVRELLANQSLLEYQNDQAWCDVHPIVNRFLLSS